MNQRDAQRLQTRRLLAEHAVRLFRDRGFDETRVDDIAEAAGVSPRTFFLHFASKSAAAFPDHDERVAAFAERLGSASDQPNPLQHMCRVMSAGLTDDSTMRRIRNQLLATIGALRDEDERGDRDYQAVMVAYLTTAWGDSGEAHVRAHAVANAMLGVARAALMASGDEGLDVHQLCAELLARMFGSPFDVPLQSVVSIQVRSS
jgi:AcrR family transcriptional regulator